MQPRHVAENRLLCSELQQVACTLKEFNEYRQYLTTLKLEAEKMLMREECLFLAVPWPGLPPSTVNTGGFEVLTFAFRLASSFPIHPGSALRRAHDSYSLRADAVEQDHILVLHYCAIGICSSISLLLFLLFCCIRLRGAAQQKKRRIITQQQVSSVEESLTESTAVRDMATTYATVGESFEQPQPRPTPEVVYISVTSPGPPGPDAGPYHLPV
ncbi:PREDICTED: uncharacterized protein LOC103925902 [Pygoscelis adeliae]|uniref:uncharacterized protein LOC103925902 n=1 Tax=Pygoscelis adeliae TaxID=9238 RepID=UPI0004F4F55F|nr:PREDICTED: uncharacterized protein LOC103925902 [Pygoscelis adeliae]